MPIKITRKKAPGKKPLPKPKDEISVHSSAPKRTAFGRLMTSIGPDYMPLVESRLLNGDSAESIAKTIKLEWKLCADMKLSNLVVQLNKYRRDNLLGRLQYLSEHQNKSDSLHKFGEKVDVLENLTTLVELQQGRVSKAMRAEDANNPMLPLSRSTKFEVQLLGNLYKQLSDLQMDLGLLRKVPAKLQIEGGAARAQQALEQAMQRSSRVEQALSKAFDVIDGKFNVVPTDASPVKH